MILSFMQLSLVCIRTSLSARIFGGALVIAYLFVICYATIVGHIKLCTLVSLDKLKLATLKWYAMADWQEDRILCTSKLVHTPHADSKSKPQIRAWDVLGIVLTSLLEKAHQTCCCLWAAYLLLWSHKRCPCRRYRI